MLGQRTIANAVGVSGVGLHSGDSVRVTIRPADAGAGVVFRRVDLDTVWPVAATYANVVDTRFAT